MLRSKPLFASDSITYLLLESFLIAAAMWLGYEIRFSAPFFRGGPFVVRFVPIVVAVVVTQGTIYYNGLYEKKPYRPVEVVFKILFSLLIATGCLTVCYYIFPILTLGRGVFVISFGLCAIFLIAARLTQIYLFGSGKIGQRIIILGTGDRAMNIARLISQKKGSGYTLLGFVESDEDWTARRSRLATGNKPVLTLMGDSHEPSFNLDDRDVNSGAQDRNTATARKEGILGITNQKGISELIKRFFRFKGSYSRKAGNNA